MVFDWDSAKAESNLRKHGVRFELAITVFDDPHALIAPDPKHSQNEAREWIIGESDSGVLVVVFTRRVRSVYRIISARRANRRERKLYEEYKTIPV